MNNARSLRRLIRLVSFPLLLATLAASVLASGPAHAQRHSLSFEAVTAIDDGSRTGTSVLQRGERGIRAVVWTSGLTRGDAYTVWAVVFNNPSACDGPCDAADLADPDTESASTLFTGKVARGGHAVFVDRLRVGDALTDPANAEIHLIVRTHGPAIPELLDEQLSTLNGGCPPNECANVQMSIHGR